ncbi:MAG: enoyl-CoA hydratase/isomerase family protein [Candidatus Rokubacteria bacterium]|nr:enoyl-CoA hydratase/isomerase family protein [Candidatus Rokubacteria bacterium]
MRPWIRLDEDGVFARVTLDRPPLNILTIDMLADLNRVLESLVPRTSLKAVILAGTGRAFSAGVAVEDHVGERVKPMLEAFHRTFRLLGELDCATVAAVQGAALGGGAELATFCDVVVASDTATLGQPEIKVGVFAPIAALHYPARIGVPRTLRMLLGGDVLTAAEAERIGLVDRVVPADRLAEAVDAELARLRGLSAAVLRLTKRAVRDSAGLPFAEGLALLEEIYHCELMRTADAEEGLRAFVEKRPPVWKDR